MLMKDVNRESERPKNFTRKITLYIELGVLLLLAFSFFSGISRMKEVSLRIDKEQEKVDKLRKENEELRINLEIASSEEFIEKQLRDKLGLAKEGEIVVILPDEEVVKRFAPGMDKEEKITPDPNWRKWILLFGF